MGIKNLLMGRKNGSDPYLQRHAAEVSRFAEIYEGGGDWRYTRKGGINGGTRRVASLGAARAVCAELSRLCFTEGTKPVSADKDALNFIKQTLDNNRFYQRFPAFLQKMFALGGGAVKVYWDNGVKLDMVDADCFVPTSWDNKGITGAAFGSELNLNGKTRLLIETQQLEGDKLAIENRLYSDTGAPLKLRDELPALNETTVINGMKQPLFTYFSTGLSGEFAPLGASVLKGAEDTLKSADLIFDSLMREFVLGKKRIIVPYYAVRGEYDENGEVKHYFDVNDEVFQAMSVSDTEEFKITDNTAQLRVTEHTEALSALLDLLCMQVGLSEGALSYKDGSIKTAAEVVSRNSRTYRTAAFFRGIIADALKQVFRNICVLGKLGGLLPDTAEETAEIMFADGAADDDSTRTNRAVTLYKEGLISKETALEQIYGTELLNEQCTMYNEQ